MTPKARRRQRHKRAFDLVVGFIAFAMALPLMLAIAIALRLRNDGPIFFVQERVGRDRQPFRMFKFRTMHADAERETGPVWSWTGDPRVTRLGQILRATHLDELPQLWNVFRGEMSLVGPRPERAEFMALLEPVIPGYSQRLEVPPGITGLSQLRSGYDHSTRTVRRKLRYDRVYVENSCASVDARILVETIVLSFRWSGGSTRTMFIRGLKWISAAVSWNPGPRSAPPRSNAATPARGLSRRAGTGLPGSAAAG